MLTQRTVDPIERHSAGRRDVPAAERAYSMTKELVLSGEFPGGHFLTEGVIAERLGMSRTPVREAFIRLRTEGLLQLMPRRGAVVVPVQRGEAEDVLDAREAVETAAVRRLTSRPNEIAPVLAHLRAALSLQREHAETGGLAEFVQADEVFHRAIVGAGRNTFLIDFYATLADRQRRMSIHALGPTMQQWPLVLCEHEKLIDIIESGDPESFASALRAHLDWAYRHLDWAY
ncbi:GntR family transcriptional regulator [Streptomyces sp. NPDC005373]|uniref:GntR family transcriptional regulator n=1 Tax=Streptomyces sp. NPDC005373 TaxID=3156879 RepID=UPI0033A61AE6